MGQRLRGQWREARGHRHVGGFLNARHEARHYEAATVALIVGAVAAVAAAGVSAYATYSSYQNQQKAAKYNRQVAENQATASRQAAQIEADMRRDRARRIISAQRAEYGQAGVDVSEGSPLLVQADTAYQGELDAQRALYGGELQATGAESQAGFFEFQRRAAASAGPIATAGVGLAGASQAASMYGSYRARQQPKTSTGAGNTLLSSGAPSYAYP